jgi:amidohydrolase
MKGVSHVFGIHLWNTLQVGEIGLSEGPCACLLLSICFIPLTGPVMANSDRFFVKVQGRGGHGSMPHDTRDPVLV